MLLILPLARRQLRKMPIGFAEAMLDALEALALDPSEAHDVKKLAGQRGAYRLRKGGFRAVFRFDRERNVVVEAVFDRKDAPY